MESKITGAGQISIPKKIRQWADVDVGDYFIIEQVNGDPKTIKLTPAKISKIRTTGAVEITMMNGKIRSMNVDDGDIIVENVDFETHPQLEEGANLDDDDDWDDDDDDEDPDDEGQNSF